MTIKVAYMSQGEQHGVMPWDRLAANWRAAGIEDWLIQEAWDSLSEDGYFVGVHEQFDDYQPVVVVLDHIGKLIEAAAAPPKIEAVDTGCLVTDEEACEDHANHWNEDVEFSAEDWRYEVGNGDTRLSYREWVRGKRDGN